MDGETKEPHSADGEQPETRPAGAWKKLFLVGLLASIGGAVAGLILAPWRGAETRRKLREMAAAAGTAAKDKAGAAKDKASELIHRGTQDESRGRSAADDAR